MKRRKSSSTARRKIITRRPVVDTPLHKFVDRANRIVQNRRGEEGITRLKEAIVSMSRREERASLQPRPGEEGIRQPSENLPDREVATTEARHAIAHVLPTLTTRSHLRTTRNYARRLVIDATPAKKRNPNRSSRKRTTSSRSLRLRKKRVMIRCPKACTLS